MMSSDRREAVCIAIIALFILAITILTNSPYGLADWAIPFFPVLSGLQPR